MSRCVIMMALHHGRHWHSSLQVLVHASALTGKTKDPYYDSAVQPEKLPPSQVDELGLGLLDAPTTSSNKS